MDKMLKEQLEEVVFRDNWFHATDSQGEFEEVLDFIKKQRIFQTFNTSEVDLKVSESGLFAADEEELKEFEGSHQYLEDIKKDLERTQIYLSSAKSKKNKILISQSAENKLWSSFGIDCQLVRESFAKRPQDFFITKTLDETKRLEKPLYAVKSFHKIRGFMGQKTYSILPQEELFSFLDDDLNSKYWKVTFKEGYVSHDICFANWEIKDDLLSIKAKKALDDDNATFGVSLKTSDTGSSKVYVQTSCYTQGKVVFLGNSIEIEHNRNRNIADFLDDLNNLNASMSNFSGKIEDLDNIDIKYPSNVINTIGTQAGIHAIALREILEEIVLFEDLTALNCYLFLHEAVDYMKDKNLGSKERRFEIVEKLATYLNPAYDWAKIDIPTAIGK